MNVAIFTDNDFDKVNGVTTTFTAALRVVPAGMHLRVYTAGPVPVETDSYLALRSIGIALMHHTMLVSCVVRATAARRNRNVVPTRLRAAIADTARLRRRARRDTTARYARSE